MNPNLDKLQSYPFEKRNALLAGATPNAAFSPIQLYIGEPKHPTPQFIRQALIDNFADLASYPATAGLPASAKSGMTTFAAPLTTRRPEL